MELYNNYSLSEIRIFRESAEKYYDLSEYGMNIYGRGLLSLHNREFDKTLSFVYTGNNQYTLIYKN